MSKADTRPIGGSGPRPARPAHVAAPIADRAVPARRHRRSSPRLHAGIAILSSVVALGVAGVATGPRAATAMNIAGRLQPPDAAHWLGTDQFGRDVAARIAGGALDEVTMALAAVAIGLVGGTLIGSIAAYFDGWLDEALGRGIDTLHAFPSLLLALVVLTIAGPGKPQTVFALGISAIPAFARISRGIVLTLNARGFAEAARALGARDSRVIVRHLLPNAAGPLIVQASIAAGNAVLAQAALSYLGLGVQPPAPSWGRMLQEATAYMHQAPWTAWGPGIAIAWLVLGFNLAGDGLADLRRRAG